MAGPGWCIEQHLGLAGLAEIETDWRRLYDEMDSPAAWHHYDAFCVYARTLCPNRETLRLLALHDGVRVRAILPVEQRTDSSLGFPLTVWGLCWDETWRPTDAVGPEDASREHLLPCAVEHLRRQHHHPALFVMGQTPANALVWRGLGRIAGAFCFDDAVEVRFRTDMSFGDFTARMKRCWRKPLNSDRRRFEALEGSEYVRARTPDELEAEFDRLIKVEGSGWKGSAGTALSQDSGRVEFYREMARNVRDGGRCEIDALHLDGECIAATFCVVTKHEVAEYKTGHDERFREYSPGVVLAHRIFEWACEDPEMEWVTGISEAPWMRRWGPEERVLQRAYVPLGVLGAALVPLYRLRYGLVRKVARALKQLGLGDGGRPSEAQQ